MTRETGTRIGPYEITGSLGAGGMGEVYRARDTRLGRDVAIKILPERFGLDAEKRARFDREARVLASLNHPHVGAIYGIEESAGTRALVLELIPGPTLADWLREGPLPQRDALRIATQIASALAAAHERGIVHRDLKPANVILAGAGRSPAARGSGGSAPRDSGPRTGLNVKVVDFGLAKESARQAATDPESPTVTLEATSVGTVMGTAAYMSPEQARADAVDGRTDIWAFGCVLYEMLVGRSPFAATTLTDTLAAIVSREPDWSALPAETPSDVRRLLRRSLEKDPAERLRDAHDLRLALEDREQAAASTIALSTEATRQGAPTRSVMVAAAMTMIGGVILGMLGAIYFLGRGGTDAPAAPEKRLEIVTPPTEEPASFAISRDGTRIVFVASADGKSLLWLRSLDSTEARPLAGTEGATFPFWSPDGRAVAFFADRALKRIDLELGSIQVLSPAEGGRGGSWGPDGTIVFQPSAYLPSLVRVAVTGGEATPYEAVAGRFPQFLPDGRHFLYYSAAEAVGTGPGSAVFVAALDGSGVRRLLEADSSAIYGSGHLLFVRGATLLAQRFDPETLVLTGDAFPLAADVSVLTPHRVAPISAAPEGPIVYRTGNVGVLRQFVWVDRGGGVIATVGERMTNPLAPNLSLDGRIVAFYRMIAGNNDILLLDLARDVLERLTTDATNDFSPVWSPDGRRIAFCSSGDLLVRSLGGDAAVERLPLPTARGELRCPVDWSRDGRFLLYTTGRSGPSNFWVLPMDPRGEPVAFAHSEFQEFDGQFSPDGRWIAYTSDESGRPEVVLGRFPGPLGKQRVSNAGGGMARWRSDGRELFYVALDGKLMSVPLEVSAAADAIEAGPPAPLFEAKVGPAFQANSTAQYVVAPGGQRFLMNRIVEQTAAPLTVLLDWRPASTSEQ